MQLNKEICIDLGSGMRTMKDNGSEKWYGVDIRKFEGIYYVLDIGKEKLPFKDNSVKFIRSIHLFEHLYPEQLFFSVDECWRVLKPKGCLHIEVPKAGTMAYYIHPDHKIQFVENTFGFWQVPANGKDPHGYLTKFWHVSVLKNGNPENITVEMYPNKPHGRFPFKRIIPIDRIV